MTEARLPPDSIDEAAVNVFGQRIFLTIGIPIAARPAPGAQRPTSAPRPLSTPAAAQFSRPADCPLDCARRHRPYRRPQLMLGEVV
ncbi:hypothetical protein [Streptomyces sp. CC228A]|uniref:hypothetical protein n=1 Tax=Streptomyces sp. CC228A TaxID=2898186 RepID=UPI001F357CAB|nr:hypothetical protein [Streptomyces sp. CC228A]